MSFSLLSVTFKALCRRWVASLLLVAVAAAGTVSAIILNGLILRQEEALENTIENTVISCTVTDPMGTIGGKLGMLSNFVEMLDGRRRENGCLLDDYVENVRALSETILEEPKGNSFRRILSLDSDPLLDPANGTKVEFFEGETEEIFKSREQVCIITSDIPTFDGYAVISGPTGEKVRLRVIGTVSGNLKGIIYCPFFMPYSEGTSVAFYTDSCSFDIIDNRKLEESKAAIYEEYFVEPNPANKADGLTYGVVVHDEAYLKNLEEINSTLSMLRILLPALIIICGCIGFFAGFLMTKGRIREFATMRCIGMKKTQIFFLVIGELLFLAAFGMLLGGGIGFIIEGNLSPKAISDSAIITAVYIIGTAIAALRIVRINIMKLSNKEE